MHSITLAAALLILCTSSLGHAAAVSPSYTDDAKAANHRQLWARQDLDIQSVCPLNQGRGLSPLTNIFDHFGVITYNNYVTLNGNFASALAIGGAFDNNGVTAAEINSAHPATCAVGDPSDVYSYGLAVNGLVDVSAATTVFGNVVADGTDSIITPSGENCAVYPSSDSVIDFNEVKSGLLAASRYLATLAPDLIADSSGIITVFENPVDPRYKVLTVNTCDPTSGSPTCSSWPLYRLSSAKMFSPVETDWNGILNPGVFDDAQTVVVNVPVTQGLPLSFRTDPSLGMKNCKTIYNFYSVDANGDFIESDTTFNVVANNDASTFEGLILAPNAAFTSYNGALAGKLFIDSIIDLTQFNDFSCDTQAYSGCFPVADYRECTTTTTATTTATEETTTTEPSTTTTDYSTTTSTVETTVASTTTTVTRSPTITVLTTTTDYTTTYTTDHSTITSVVTTTAPVYVPVKNDYDDKKGDREHEDWEDKKGSDWKDRKDDDWEDRKQHDWKDDKEF